MIGSVASPAAAPPDADARALDLLHRHGDHSSGFLAFNRATCHHMPADVDGLVAYRRAGRGHVFQLLGPLAAPEDRERLLASFRDLAAAEGRRITAVQLRRDDAELYARNGFTVNQLGTSYGIELEAYHLRGTAFFRIRNKIKRATRAGVSVTELSEDDPEGIAASPELDAIDAHWLREKGRHVKELEFMIGERGGRGRAHRRVFLARRDGEAIAYVTYSPVFGERPGWLYDLTRRAPTSPPGVIELIFDTAARTLQEEGCRWLHLGLTPFVGLDPALEVPGATSRMAGRALRLIAERGESVYPAASQAAFKLKWSPTLVEPEYMAFEGGMTPSAVWHLFRLTRTL